MPQGINDFMRVASGLPQDTPLLADENHVTRAPDKSRGTYAQRMKADSETARIFFNAVRNHPYYAKAKAGVEIVLCNQLAGRAPLCPEDVQMVMLHLNMSKAREIGDKLEKAGILPKNCKLEFAKHAVAKFGSLDGEHAVRMAARDFLVQSLISNSVNNLLPLDSNHETLSLNDQRIIHRALALYHGAPNVESYMKRLVIKTIADGLLPGAPEHPELGKGLAGLSKIGITNLFAQDNKDEIRLLAALPQQTRLEVLEKPDLLRTLMEVQGKLSISEQVEFVKDAEANHLPLSNQAERTTALRDFMFSQSAQRMEPLPAGLPAQFSLPLALNPEVKNKALAVLQADLGPGVLPSKEQIDTALLQARNEFATAHAPLLNEFVQMAQDPPAGLDLTPPFTPQTLPQYLNVLLSGDAVLEPVFNDSRPVDADYFRTLLLHDQGIEAARKMTEGLFGINEADRMHESAIKLLIARRGVDETEYPAMVERSIARFGRAIGELTTLSGEAFKQGNSRTEHDVATVSRMLRTTMVNMAEQLTPENRKTLNVSEDNGKMMNELFSSLDTPSPLNELSPLVHDFGASLGIKLPPTNGAVARNDTEKLLLDANNKIVSSTLNRILGDEAQLRTNSSAFSEMASDLAAELHLSNLDTSKLEPKLFLENASKIMYEMAAEATSKNATLDKEVLRSALRQSMAVDMTEMHSLIAQIDRLPKPGHLTAVEHAEHKNIMKDMVHLHSVTDVAVLSQMLDKAARSTNSLDKLRAPMATPLSVAMAVSTLATDYADLVSKFGANAMPQHATMPCFLDMALRSCKIDAASAARIQENITGRVGKGVAASCRFIMDANNYTAEQKARPQRNHDMMTHLVTMSSVLANGTAVHNPQVFTDRINHLSEIPAGCLSTIVPSNTAMQERLNLFGSRLSSAEWDLLENVGKRLGSGMASYELSQLASIMATNASSILNAARTVRDPAKSMTVDQVATAVMGSQLTSKEKKNGTTDGARLCNAVISRYTAEVNNCFKNVEAMNIQKALTIGMANGFSFSVLKALASPAGELTLENLPSEALELGSLGNYTAENAFGLKEDFPRLNGGSITLNDAAGNKQVYSPTLFPKGDLNIPANHKVFQSIIKDVSNLSASDAQKLRVMHLFTQAGRKCVGMSAHAFLSDGSEGGAVPAMHYTVERKANNILKVTMKNIKTSPLEIEQAFEVDANGGYKTTAFLMKRRSVNANQSAQPAQSA